MFLSGCSGNGGSIPPITTNQSPIASFTTNPTSGIAPLEVSFNASSSFDSDGSIISYEWEFKDGDTGSGETVNHTFSSTGSYEVELTVTDNEGATDSTTKTIIVTETPNQSPDEWLSNENEFFIIKYCFGYENDTEKILDYCNFARNTVMSKYPHKLPYKPTVLVYDRLHWSLSEWTMITNSGSTSGEVSMLAPSDQTNPYYDNLWYQKNIIHEYTHLPFYYDLYSKPQGYRDCPDWFNQGLAEYFAVFCSTPSILQKYAQKLTEIKNMVKNGNGYLVYVGRDAYYGGAYIAKYMHEVYGQDKVANLIKSSTPSFLQAINKELNVISGEFEDEWLKWACKEFDADHEQLYAP